MTRRRFTRNSRRDDFSLTHYFRTQEPPHNAVILILRLEKKIDGVNRRSRFHTGSAEPRQSLTEFSIRDANTIQPLSRSYTAGGFRERHDR